MPDIRTVGVFSKPVVPAAAELVPKLFYWLRGRGLHIRCDEETAAYGGQCEAHPREEVPDGCDLIVVLGGDGTLLSAARAVSGREIPIFPVNLGGLGFLTAITLEEVFPELERAFRGEHRVGKRRMLQVELVRGGRTVGRHEALNDAVITKSSLARMIDVDAHVNDMFVCAYKADGLIVATPTGSTAYSLSAGGPIIFPSVAAFCLTPICPHTLTNRPVIVPESSVIRLESLAENGAAFLTIDGQIGEPLLRGDQIVCRRSEHTIHLILPPRMRYFDVLRAKLKWGER